MSEAYSRLYHRFGQEFPAIYRDDHALATWVRLLLVADASWPMHPPIPRSIKTRPLTVLCDAGLVTVDDDCYTVRGLDAERGRRRDAGRIGAAVRWDSERNATALPSKAKQRRDETSIARGPSTDEADGRVDLEAFLMITRRAPTPKQRRLLDGVLDRRDLTGPEWAADVMYRHPDDPIGAVIAADKVWRDERIAEAQAQDVPKPKPRRSSGLPETTREIMAEMALLRAEDANGSSRSRDNIPGGVDKTVAAGIDSGSRVVTDGHEGDER
jgi:hypothetical protein